jgi:hypothetical protein
MTRRSNFTEAQKAQLFVLHRATCVYTGEKLWLLDGGATPYFTIDWADHLVPVARGGASTIENGVCASWHYNKKKNASEKKPEFLFFKGKPRALYFKQRSRLPLGVVRDLERLGTLHHSDWYFNRAIFRVLLGVDWLDNGVGVRTRDDRYYAAAALKAIRKWRILVARELVPSLEQRKLVPRRPRYDQKLLLALRSVDSIPELRTSMKKLLPTYRRLA